jgi:hypothetical protein
MEQEQSPQQEGKSLTYDNFSEKYTLVENHIGKHSSFEGCMFETYDKELEFVRSCDPKRIWTVIDCDGWFGITAGYHWINRVGYLITNEEWESDTEEFVICDEGPVNDWFNNFDTEEQKKVFGERDLHLDTAKDIADQLTDSWNDLSVDEKEDLMENFKNKNNEK